MNKKIIAMVLLALVCIPLPRGPYEDGGTREYSALAYKIVDWNRLYDDGVYEATKLYWFPSSLKSIDALWADEAQSLVHRFVATVLEQSSTSVLVQPLEGEVELSSSSQFSIHTENLEDIGADVGAEVEIFYTGGIMETYPAQVHAIRWELAKTLRQRPYSQQWLDKETAERYDNNIFDHIVITKIYSNCFFAQPVTPTPYTIKLNGTLSEEWCVGDQVICTYQNTYYDAKHHRAEVDFLTVEASDWAPEPGMAYKPVIYLYPEEETDVSVRLVTDGALTCTYPAYNDGWNVTAAPDGTLTDSTGQTYNYLYWEGETNAQWDLSKGFCVKGADTAAFLEHALEKLGLNRKEANEFIVYWLPLMEKNPYNIISFQAEDYTDAAQLHIVPAPDTLLRVFMVYAPSDVFVSMEAQELRAPQRSGFTVVEWGGTALSGE